MSPTTYTLESDEKATQVMLGTSDMLVWGSLITKEHVRMVGFLTTLAEDFVPLHDAKVLFLTPPQQAAPIERPVVYIKFEEILFFFTMGEQEPLPEETEVRHFVPIEVVVGSFQIEGVILKSPIATLQNLLLVSKDAYLKIYKVSVRHVAKPWLGAFTTNMVQIRRDRMAVMEC